LHVRQNTVIPAQAGIQTEEFNPDSLAPCLRRGDGKTELANGVPDSRVYSQKKTGRLPAARSWTLRNITLWKYSIKQLQKFNVFNRK
jgi:hypothetical protein